MTTEQNMIQVMTQAAKALIMAVKEAEYPVNAAKSVQGLPMTGAPALKQPAIDWKWEL